MATVQERLNTGSPSDIADALRFISFGDLLAGLTPVEATETVASGTVHVIPTSGQVQTMSTAGTALVIVDSTVTPGAGEVSIAYDANGVPTATFQAAVTTYTYTQTGVSTGLAGLLAATAYVEP
jgi:hypothetical protein